MMMMMMMMLCCQQIWNLFHCRWVPGTDSGVSGTSLNDLNNPVYKQLGPGMETIRHENTTDISLLFVLAMLFEKTKEANVFEEKQIWDHFFWTSLSNLTCGHVEWMRVISWTLPIFNSQHPTIFVYCVASLLESAAFNESSVHCCATSTMLTQETLETGSPDLHLMKALLFPESLTLADSPAVFRFIFVMKHKQ